MARGEFTHDSAPPSPRPHSHSLQLLWQVSRSQRRANTDAKVMSYEQEEGGCWCKVVEGIKAESEATSFIVQLLSELSKPSFWVLLAPCGRWMRSRLERSTTTSSFCTRSFWIRLQHRLNKMLRRVLCL